MKISLLKNAIVLLIIAVSFSLAQTSPLIMKHADNLEVARTRGSLLLKGNVHFVHDSMDFKTQKAMWNRDAEILQCDGGFLATHPQGFIQADNGVYRKKQGIASASGNVSAADSAKTYMFKGDYLVYDREAEVLTMPKRPTLYQFEKKKDGTIDTLTIEANRIIYNKKENFAQAFEKVKITQKQMIVTCDSGFFNRKNNWLSMSGHPTCDLENYHLTGDSIFLVLDSLGKTLKSALVIKNAHGIQQEKPKKDSPGSVTEAFGDTLYCEFVNDKIEHLYVNLNAKGFFYELDLPDYRNNMDGERLDLFFKKGKMDHALVSGNAQSTYFYVKKDRSVSGKNEAAGDTINIIFDAQKNAVKSLKLLGNTTLASGRYVDLEKEARNKKKLHNDSLSQILIESKKNEFDKTLNKNAHPKERMKNNELDDASLTKQRREKREAYYLKNQRELLMKNSIKQDSLKSKQNYKENVLNKEKADSK